MLRAVVSSTLRSPIRSGHVLRPAYHYFVRLESNAADDPLKQARKLQDDKQRDWDARILTYAEVKPKTQSPSPASIDSFCLRILVLIFST